MCIKSFEYLQMEGSTYSPTYILENHWDTGAPGYKLTPVEYETVYEGTFKNNFLGYVGYQPFIDDICRGVGIPQEYWGNNIPTPSSLHIKIWDSPFPHLEVYGT